MKKIKLRNSTSTVLVDDIDFKWLNQGKWRLQGGYACKWETNKGHTTRRLVRMHRLILCPPKEAQIDHANGNKLDNRRGNLRLANSQQNAINRKKTKGLTSVFRGVSWSKSHKRWRSEMRHNGKLIFIGDFEKGYHAAMAHDIWAKDIQGKFAVLNFTP